MEYSIYLKLDVYTRIYVVDEVLKSSRMVKEHLLVNFNRYIKKILFISNKQSINILYSTSLSSNVNKITNVHHADDNWTIFEGLQR